jgi:hypothetical protein
MKEANAAAKPGRALTKRRSASAAALREPQLLSARLTVALDPERRRQMVAEAAYFYAEHRGFEPGHEVEDWLAAESQIDAALRLASLDRP